MRLVSTAALIGCLLSLFASTIFADPPLEQRRVVLITLDGLRGEEVFGGADQRLIVKENGVDDVIATTKRFWRETPEDRREVLMPFLWETCQGQSGWIAGDVTQDSHVAVTNGLYFSYPGYNEILSGFPDAKVNSNAKTNNQNITVLEWLHSKPEFAQSVAAYCSWDVFPFIINESRSGIPVNAGWEDLVTGDPETIRSLNYVANNLFHEWDGVRYDSFTASGAIQEMTTKKPKVLFVALGETDDWAHKGRYDRYLLTANQNDGFIRDLYQTAQRIPEYQDKTLFIVTSDHGRGDGREGWKNHSVTLPGSERIWLAAFGPGLSRSGIDSGGNYEQAQVAATVAAYLGHDFQKHHEKVRPPLPILKL
jgi:hypothetical protein